jgi:hypothetical protein
MHLGQVGEEAVGQYLEEKLRPMGGRLLLSIPATRPDINPETRRDRNGRYFADVPPAKLKLLLERVGFRMLWERASDDALGRAGYSWATFLFERRKEDEERPLDQVESILNRDKKDATYKLALFRALADIAQTQYNVACYDLPGRVGIPVQTLAERWMVYYWPIVESDVFIPQKYGETPDCAKPVAIRKPLQAVIEAFGQGSGLPAFMVALKNGGLSSPVQQIYKKAIRRESKVSLAVEKLLSISDPERETRDARLLFSKLGVTECVWSGRAIQAEKFDVDHVIPFALWRNNDLSSALPAIRWSRN